MNTRLTVKAQRQRLQETNIVPVDQPSKMARSKAMSLLARREHSARELSDKLVRKGIDAESASEAITKLTAEGLQSDSRFTENYCRSRTAKGFGPRRIRLELQERGISTELANEYIDASDSHWRTLAQQQLQKKFNLLAATDLHQLATMKRFLDYRGFDSHWLRLS